LTFGFLGSVSPVKNVPLLLSAFMKTRGDACLLLRGTANDEAKAMLAHASQQDARITYGGAYLPSELGAVLAAIDVLVLPSLQESYSLVIREAFFAGVPVIAARVGAIPEIVVNMENGMMFDSCDEGALLRCLETIIAEPSLIKRFVLNIPRVKTIAQDAAEWIKRYRAAIAGKRRAVPSSEFVGFDFSAEIGQDAHRLAALGRVRQHYAAGRFAFAEKILFSEFGETPRMKDVCARMRNTPAVGAEAEHA
jgi:glycosyltransferase involved in cell wall biosynthesis